MAAALSSSHIYNRLLHVCDDTMTTTPSSSSQLRSSQTAASPPQNNQRRSLSNTLKRFYILLSQEQYDVPFVVMLLVFECILCRLIISYVSYTEIDWIAYMQEVTMWQEGELDYVKIRGDTGPLVYPAGFLYLYGILKHFTQDGTDIFKGQTIFGYFYLMTTGLVLTIYTLCARRMVKMRSTDTTTTTNQQQQFKLANIVWSWRLAMVVCCLSKRIHSIYILRLFNDGPSMTLLYLSVLLFMRHYWRLGCFVFSLAVSIKMNILLFAPGLLLLLLQQHTIQETFLNLSICAITQVILGAPFLTTYPISYLRKAFELDRVFIYKWTVNWKFLSEEMFVSKKLSVLLLGMHLLVLGLLCAKWIRAYQQHQKRRQERRLTPEYIVYTLMVSNFVGICFARTLHYQFYIWYFHSLGLMLWISDGLYPIYLRLALIILVEYAFNVYPATPTSSAVLQLAHFVILTSVFVSPAPTAYMMEQEDDDNDKQQTSSSTVVVAKDKKDS